MAEPQGKPVAEPQGGARSAVRPKTRLSCKQADGAANWITKLSNCRDCQPHQPSSTTVALDSGARAVSRDAPFLKWEDEVCKVGWKLFGRWQPYPVWAWRDCPLPSARTKS